MKILDKIKNWFAAEKQNIVSYLKRNITAYLIAIFSLWFKDYCKDDLRLFLQGMFYISIAIPITGFVKWGLTKLELQTRDTAIIYFAVILIFAFCMFMK